jgi:hypothetical protein
MWLLRAFSSAQFRKSDSIIQGLERAAAFSCVCAEIEFAIVLAVRVTWRERVSALGVERKLRVAA